MPMHFLALTFEKDVWYYYVISHIYCNRRLTQHTRFGKFHVVSILCLLGMYACSSHIHQNLLILLSVTTLFIFHTLHYSHHAHLLTLLISTHLLTYTSTHTYSHTHLLHLHGTHKFVILEKSIYNFII